MTKSEQYYQTVGKIMGIIILFGIEFQFKSNVNLSLCYAIFIVFFFKFCTCSDLQRSQLNCYTS